MAWKENILKMFLVRDVTKIIEMKQSSENVAKNEVRVNNLNVFEDIFSLKNSFLAAMFVCPNLFCMLYDVKASGSKI